jgi:hypothetical protein
MTTDFSDLTIETKKAQSKNHGVLYHFRLWFII